MGIFHFLLCALLSSAGVFQAHAAETYSAEVIKVIDGDSLVVQAGTRGIELRLYGVDSPEYDQPFSRKAARFVRRLVLGRQVTVAPHEIDRYGRMVAVVSVDGRALNGDLVAAGLAWVSPRYCRKPVCRQWQQLQEQARLARTGLWQENQPVPPWRWKMRKRSM